MGYPNDIGLAVQSASPIRASGASRFDGDRYTLTGFPDPVPTGQPVA